MKFAAGLCLMFALGATVATAESPSPLKTDLFRPHDDIRAWSLQTSVETPAPVLTRELRLAAMTLKTARGRALQAQLTIGAPSAPSAPPAGDVRGQALVTVHMSFRTLPSP